MRTLFSCFSTGLGVMGALALTACTNGVQVGADDGGGATSSTTGTGAGGASAPSSSSSLASTTNTSASTTSTSTMGQGGGGQGGGTPGAGGSTSTGSAGGEPGALCPEVDVTGWSCTPNNYHDPLVSFVADSGLIFRGKVTALHATTVGIDLPDTSDAVVVEVENDLYNPGTLPVDGQGVTVVLLAAPTMAVGYEGYFFTQVWSIGQSVGVTEIAHIDVTASSTIDADVPGIETLLADRRLYARMDTAASVVVGTVTDVEPLPDLGPISEHDPLWAAATIQVDCTLRGATLSTATLAFATSGDVAWFNSPKLTVGQTGVFVMQPVPSPPGSFMIANHVPYVVTDPLDVQPESERPHVATLVLCPPTD